MGNGSGSAGALASASRPPARADQGPFRSPGTAYPVSSVDFLAPKEQLLDAADFAYLT